MASSHTSSSSSKIFSVTWTEEDFQTYVNLKPELVSTLLNYNLTYSSSSNGLQSVTVTNSNLSTNGYGVRKLELLVGNSVVQEITVSHSDNVTAVGTYAFDMTASEGDTFDTNAYSTGTMSDSNSLTFSEESTNYIRLRITYSNSLSGTNLTEYHILGSLTVERPNEALVVTGLEDTYTYGAEYPGDLTVTHYVYFVDVTGSVTTTSTKSVSAVLYNYTEVDTTVVGTYEVTIDIGDSAALYEENDPLEYTATITVEYNYGLIPNTANLGSSSSPIKLSPYSDDLDVASLISTCSISTDTEDEYATIDSSEFSVSPETLTYEDAVSAAGGSVAITVTAEYNGEEFTATVYIWLMYAIPESITCSNTTDSNTTYYYDTVAKFVSPSFLDDEDTTLTLVYDNGDTEDLTESISELEIRTDATDSSTALTSGEEFATQDSLYVGLTVTDGSDNSYFLYFEYELNLEIDTISDVTLTDSLEIVYGNYLSIYEDSVSFTVSFNNISTTLSSDDLTWYFTNTSMFVSESDDLTVTISDFSGTYELSGTITFSIPAISSITFGGTYVTSFVNEVTTIDLRNLVIYVAYSGATYVSEYTYDDLGINYTVAVTDTDGNTLSSFTTFDGTDVVDETMGSDSTLSGKYTFTVNNEFSSSSTQTATLSFIIMGLIDITGISIGSNPYTGYTVNDTFLNSDDDTTITIFYVDSSDVTRSKTMLLNSGFSSIATLPTQGHVLTNVDYSKTVKVYSVLNSNVYAEYTTVVSPRYSTDNLQYLNLVAVWVDEYDDIDNDYGLLMLVDESETTLTNGVRTLNTDSPTYYGYITDIFDENANARVVLFNDYIAPESGASNIKVKFPSYYEGAADAINNCHFGVLFGTNNATNRLFVSGNPEVANADWHSAEISIANLDGEETDVNGNFSYFSDESIMYYGETDNEVIGYDIVSNDKLLVLKSKSDKEKTVYFRTPTTVKALDASGTEMTDVNGDTLYQEEFALVKGNGSNAGISPKAITNFNGDSLFIDDSNNVVGLDLTGIVGDSQRYANTRSQYIDYKLKDLDLSDSILWTNNDYLFLTVPDYGMFVTHYKAVSDAQYEWWFLESKNPTAFIELENVIYFGNDEGAIYKISDDFYDVDKIFITTGDATISGQYVVVNSDIIEQMDTDESYKLKVDVDDDDYTNNLYYRVARINDGTYNDLIIQELNVYDEDSEEYVAKYVITENKTSPFIEENSIYYLNNLGTNGSIDCESGSEFAEYGAQYRFTKVETEEVVKDSYIVEKNIDDTWTELDLSELNSAALCKRIDNEELDVVDIDTTNSTFRLQLDGSYITIVDYASQISTGFSLTGEIKLYSGVECYYITAPYIFGNLNSLKTVWQFTLTNDTDIDSYLEVAYASNKIPTYKYKDLSMLSAGQIGTDFTQLSFGKVDFDKTVVPRTYTMNRVLPYQKFVCFAFKNTAGENCVLSAMTVTYTIPYPAYGGD